MALINFKSITSSDTLKNLTDAVNSIGEELSKDGNIFTIVDGLKEQMNSASKYSLVNDKGQAKSVRLSGNLSILTSTGYYYITSAITSQLSDVPQELRTNILLSVFNTDAGTVQVVNTLEQQESKKFLAYRVNHGSLVGSWRFIDTRINNRDTLVVGGYYTEVLQPGNYIVNNMKGLPDSNSNGYLSVITDDTDARSYLYISPDNKMYHAVSTGYKDLPWVKEFESKDIEPYSLSNADGSFSFILYKSDDISFEEKLKQYLNSLPKQKPFTFYVQGGVQGNPAGGNSCRGIYVSDSVNHGVYYTVDYYGNLYTGAMSGGSLNKVRSQTSSDVIWTGAKNFKDKGSVENLSYPIADYDYVKIFVTVPSQGINTSDITNDLQNFGQEFYIKGQNRASVSGVVVSSDTKFDLYRVGIAFGQKSWRITDMAKTNTKNAYITRIVGINY